MLQLTSPIATTPTTMAPTIQKALALPEARAEWKLYTDHPVLSPAPNEILVKIVAATVNPGDGWTQLHNPPFATYPWVGGFEGAGIVEEVGSQVTKFSKGDHMWVVPSSMPSAHRI